MAPEGGMDREEAIDRFWDQVVQGRVDTEAGDLTPADVTAIRWFHAIDDRPEPSSAFARHLWEDLMQSATNSIVPNRSLRVGANGHTGPVALVPVPTLGSGVGWRSWPASLATAALVLLTLLASYVAFGGPLRQHWEERPAFVPALTGTPEVRPAGVTTDEVLLQGTFDTIPQWADFSGVKRAVLQPGAVWPLGTNAEDGIGPFLYRVESGALTIRAEGPIEVTRAGSATSQTMTAGTDIVLAAGDQGLTPSGIRSQWRNEGTVPVSALTVMVATDGADPRPSGVRYDDVFIAWPMTPPPTPVQATLRRVTLGAQGSLPGGPAPGLMLVGVESGTADLVIGPPSPLATPTRSHHLTAPGWTNVNTGQWSVAGGHLGDQRTGSDVIVAIENPGPDPLTLLVLAVAPLSSPSTPVATPARLSGVSAPGPASPAEPVWQTKGGPDAPFPSGTFPAVDPSGNLWVPDGEHSRFQIFAPDGTFREMWGTTGSAEGQFDFVYHPGGWWGGAVAFDATGNIYVADMGNHRIQKFAPDRTFLLAWGSKGSGDGQFLSPFDLAVGANGNVYVMDDERNDVQVFDSNGRYLFTFGGKGEGDGQFASDVGGLGVDGAGRVYVADYGHNSVQQFSADGSFLAAWGSKGIENGQFVNPNDVVADEAGRLYVADYGNSRIQVFAADGRFLATWGTIGAGPGQMVEPVGIALDGAGHAYVSEDGTMRVQQFRLLPPLAPEGAST
jgi:hypothetical protein